MYYCCTRRCHCTCLAVLVLWHFMTSERLKVLYTLKIIGTDVFLPYLSFYLFILNVSLIYWGFIFDLFPGPFLSYYVINMKINNYTIICIGMYIYMRSLTKSFVICFLFKHLSNNSTLVTDSIDHIISIIINYITSLEFLMRRLMKENT